MIPPLHFLRPWWWLALLPLPLVLWTLARGGGGRATLARLADATLLPHLLHETRGRGRAALALAAAAWLLAVAALAGPAWQKVETPLYVNGAARVVALSLSDDMLAQDWQPDRLTHARFAVRDLIDAAGDARTALVAYAGAAFTVAPLTDDKRTVLNLLHALQPDVMPEPGNDAAAGIRRSVRLLEQAHVKGGEIVLVTDTAGSAAVAAAKAARARGIRVDVLGVGTTAGAPVPRAGGGFVGGSGGLALAKRDDAALQAVAVAGGGRYSVLRADGGGVAALGAPAAVTGHSSAHQRAQLWRDGGIWLLPALLVLGALAFRRGWLLVLAILVLPLGTPTAQAATPGNWFANRDQRALQALAAGNAKGAQALATTPAVRGAADYRAGDYAAAAKAFAHGDDARARYNLGNALAQQGDYPQAVAAYREALKRDPHNADARANLAAVEAWMRRHPKQSPQSPSTPQQAQSGSNAQRQSGGSSSQQRQGAPSSGQSSAQHGTQPQAGQSQPAQPAAGGAGSNGAPASAPQAQSQRGNPGAADGAEAQRPGAAQRAARGLESELRNARPASSASGAFALGQAPRDSSQHFDAQQRAMLNAVPDDPGALLRRKFQLEWQQRNARQQENGQP